MTDAERALVAALETVLDPTSEPPVVAADLLDALRAAGWALVPAVEAELGRAWARVERALRWPWYLASVERTGDGWRALAFSAEPTPGTYKHPTLHGWGRTAPAALDALAVRLEERQ